MSTTIEQLELEVQSSATSAVAQLDALASSLGKVKSATKGGVGLTAVARQLTTLNTALNNISSTNADNLNKMAQGLQALSSCGNLKLSSSVANQISNLGTAVRSLNGTDFSSLGRLADALTPLSTIGKSNLNSFISQLQRLPQAVQGLNGVDIGGLGTQISELVSALSPLSQMGKNNLTSFVTQLGKIPALMQSLKTVNIGELASQVQQLADAFAPLATQMQAISSGFAAFPARIQKLITSTNNLSKSNDRASTSYVNLAAKIGIAIVAVKKAASVLAGFINKSNQYVEDLNLFTASMGEYASAAQEYAERVSEIVGIDPAEWLRNQGVFMTITKGFGVASDRAYTMSRNLTQLGYDISSFFNIPFEEAFQKLQSGIAGELEPLRRLGYDLSVARLQQEAYTLGIEKKVSAMTQAEKAELRYYAINQTTTLNEKLNLAVPELKTAINLLKQYKGFLTEMETLCNSNVELSTGMFVNMKEVGQKLVTGFVDGIKSKSSDFSNAAKTLVDGFKNSLNTNAATCKSSFISWASNLKNWFTSASFGAINRTTFGNYAKDIVSGFNNGITNNYATAKSGMVSFANTVKNAFTGIVSYKVFYDIAKDVISGFNNGINDFYDTTRPYMRRWANDAAAAYKAALDSNSPSKRFMRIGEDTVLGYNLGISNLGGTTKGVVTDWANSFTSVSPTMSFAVDTSALKYYSSDSFAQSVSADVAAHSTVTATGFKEGMEEFYREYIEPTLSQMADDMRRQADKQEQTVVQIGNRVVNDAVTTQKKANGYVFAR